MDLRKKSVLSPLTLLGIARTFGLAFAPLLTSQARLLSWQGITAINWLLNRCMGLQSQMSETIGNGSVKQGTTMRLEYEIRQATPRQSGARTMGLASRITFLAKRTPVVTVCFSASMLLFIASLTQDCFFIDRAENPRAWANGFGLLMTGWLGVLVGVNAWVANPTLLVAWLAMWSPNHKRYSIGASAIALLLALSFLQHESLVTDEAGNRSLITGYGIGYWLWIGSIAIALLGSCSWISVLWQSISGVVISEAGGRLSKTVRSHVEPGNEN